MTQPQILIAKMHLKLSTNKIIFNDINLIFSQHKTGLVGRNGIGKSTLLKLILGELSPTSGTIQTFGKMAYVPQSILTSPEITVADFFGYQEKMHALHRNAKGSLEEFDYSILNDYWEVEKALQSKRIMFGLSDLPHEKHFTQLSGGEATRLMLIKAFSSKADFLLLDEPTNNLDAQTREHLYQAIEKWQGGLIVISHDRKLLNLMEKTVELTALGARSFGENYDGYFRQKIQYNKAKEQLLSDAKKGLDKTKCSIQSTIEKHQQRKAQGHALRRSGGQSKLVLNARANRSTKSQGALLTRHNRMLSAAEDKIKLAEDYVEVVDEININLPATYVPKGKILLKIENLAFSYHDTQELMQGFNLTLQGPERIALAGDNGSGKTTFIKLILGDLKPSHGKIYIGTQKVSYIDQDAALLNSAQSLLENFMLLNQNANINEAYCCLAQFGFKNKSALKLGSELSSGEKLRALLACVLLAKCPPKLLILDEPTNHLDIQSLESIESALQRFQGALLIISHDAHFLRNIGVQKIVTLKKQQ